MSESTAPPFFCFVLMPFDAGFDDVYQLGIKEACKDTGVYCERVDEQIYAERILDRIYNQIAKADLIIADMTGRNPNVFYEVGYAHALNKLVILLTRDADDIPFDLKHFPHIVYGGRIADLKGHLADRVKFFRERPSRGDLAEFPVELFLGEKNLADGDAVYKVQRNWYPNPSVTVKNRTKRTLNAGEFKIAVITPLLFPSLRGGKGEPVGSTSTLPDGNLMHVPEQIGYMFPDEYAPFDFTLHMEEPGDRKTAIQLRVFTDAERRDFPLTLTETTGRAPSK